MFYHHFKEGKQLLCLSVCFSYNAAIQKRGSTLKLKEKKDLFLFVVVLTP